MSPLDPRSTAEPGSLPHERPSQTKIVATLGPASQKPETLQKLIKAGADVFRINTAHGSESQHQAMADAVRAAERTVGRPVAILADLPGPKIRLGELLVDDGVDSDGGEYQCVTGEIIRFVRGHVSSRASDFTTTYEPLVDELQVGDRVMLVDGTIALRVHSVDADSATCLITQGGPVRSRQGVNLPGVKLSVPTLGPTDLKNAAWAARAGIDFISISFVRTADDIRQLRGLLEKQGSTAQIIAKIEKPEALDNLEAIVAEADGIMVARGDLGVEIDIARVAVVQKQIIATCHRHCKPVIVATQMLDSMQHAKRPTRAEVTDVANAIIDGTDACMLSGESAIGDYPVESVAMMHRIALATEPYDKQQGKGVRNLLPERPEGCFAQKVPDTFSPVTAAITSSAATAAEAVDAKLLVVASDSGRTTLRFSKNRCFIPTIGVSNSEAALRRMCLYWGIIPLPGAPTEDSTHLMRHLVEKDRDTGYLNPGDRIVLVTGTGSTVSQDNMMV
ncbi:MAG: pyruvate kinase, partial [Planctomycetota bacterium]|nr:pyruvate kinase [Planctomycetota bacterium]